MSNNGKQRIVDLEVNEVSLVDEAANLKRFLVVKRLEGKPMGAFKNERSVEMAMDIKKKKEDVDKMTPEEKAKLEEENKKKSQEEEEKAKKEEEEKKQKKAAEEEAEKIIKAMNPAALIGMINGLKGAPKGAVDNLVQWLESKKENGDMDEENDKESKKKSMEGLALAIHEDGTVVVSGQTVSKGKKFTPGRTNTLKEVATQLMQLISDVDEEEAKSLIAQFKELPQGKSPKSEVRPVEVSKSTGEGLVAILGQITEQNKEITKRLEAIETARTPSQSLDEEGGTDVPVNKSNGTWGNILKL